MDFNLFSYYTLGRRSELEAGLAGLRVELYQRMLDETAQIAAAGDEAGFAGIGLVRGYQYRWVENFKVLPELTAVGPWNKSSPADDLNRDHFAEYVDIVMTALTQPTFRYEGRFWQFPAPGMTNPHIHEVYTSMGAGVRDDMTIDEVGIAPRPYQQPRPQAYAGLQRFPEDRRVLGPLRRAPGGERPWRPMVRRGGRQRLLPDER
jgi:hypothetical protein